MLPEEVLKQIKCIEVKENEDGSADLIFEATDEFKKMYMEAFSLPEWSVEHFTNVINEAIIAYEKHVDDKLRS